MNKKYITFDVSGNGFCNNIIKFENLLAVAFISNRTIILDDMLHSGAVSIDSELIQNESMWSVLDIERVYQNFDCIPKKYCEKNFSNKFYFPNNYIDEKTCYCNLQAIDDTEDFFNFTLNRPIYDISKIEDELINLNFHYYNFNHYFYNVYAGNKSKRNSLKKRINDSIKYKSKYIELANKLISHPYNAIHVRCPGSFCNLPNTDNMNVYSNPSLLTSLIEKLFDRDIPLYISTDITETSLLWNKSSGQYMPTLEDYIIPLNKSFKQLILLEDFDLELSRSEKIAMDQIICSNAENFYGTYSSTFTKLINKFRGILGKDVHDYMGWNLIQNNWQEIPSPYPWVNFKGEWPWHYSLYIGYTLENEN